MVKRAPLTRRDRDQWLEREKGRENQKGIDDEKWNLRSRGLATEKKSPRGGRVPPKCCKACA